MEQATQIATNTNPSPAGISLPILFRHLAGYGLLLLASLFLSRWYFDHQFHWWILYAFCFGAAIILATKRYHHKLRTLSYGRLFVVLGLGALCLPWAEWLSITQASSRQNWSRQVLHQALFLYALLIPLDLFPSIRRTIHSGAIRFLDFFSQTTLQFLIPILFFLLTGAISLWVNDRTPFLQDSAAHLFQAKIFHELRLTAPEPALSQFFSARGDMLVMQEGRWFSMYQPGLSLLLALAMFFSAEWLLSPFLGSLTILLWMMYAKKWHGRRTAALLGLIALLSPFLLMMSSTIMIYTPELFFATVVIILCRLFTEQKGNVLCALALFGAMFGVMIVRSFSSLLFLAPVLVYTCWTSLRRRTYGAPLAILGGAIAGASFLLYYQSQTTGDPLLAGYFLEYPQLQLGFGKTHTPLKGLANLSNHLLSLNEWLTGWYSGSLLFVFAFLFSVSKVERWDWILLLGCCGIVLFYFFHSSQDLLIGPRYYYIFAGFLLLVLARGTLPENASRDQSGFLLPLLALSWISFLPVKLPEIVRQYNIPQTIPGNLHRELNTARGQQLLVFLDRTTPSYLVNWNDPFLRGHVILCNDQGEQNAQIMRMFPQHHPVYFRMDLGFDKLQLASDYKFLADPNPRPPGYFSMMQLALAGETAARYEDRNLFDVVYDDVLKGDAAAQLNFVSGQLKMPAEQNDYRAHFERGLLHTAALLLSPKVAYDQHAQMWMKHFDPDAYRAELRLAEESFGRTGPIGGTMLSELRKIRSRIDRDHNGDLSDPELIRFLNLQLSVFHELGT